jgi:hypothetical protein
MSAKNIVMAAAGAVSSLFIEDVFSTWLYTGNGSTQTITNGIDLLNQGGLVWLKARSAGQAHKLVDTVRGRDYFLSTNDTTSNDFNPGSVSSFNSNGFTLGSSYSQNTNGTTYTSWSIREAPKFFDVVTYTGNGSNRTIAHNLGSVPGCIVVKRTDTAADWQVYHRSLANTQYLVLNTTAAVATGATRWNSTTPTSTVFSLGTDTTVNASGGTYVAYLFAHDAGGFGLSGNENVISCGSYTGNGSATGPIITLGYEPQWVLIKCTSSGGPNWMLFDNMRGIITGAQDPSLSPDQASAENGTYGNIDWIEATATGFQIKENGAFFATNGSGANYIYIAIRRGPMRVPTSGASVFDPELSVATGSSVTTGFPIDLQIQAARIGLSPNNAFVDRLRGVSTNTTDVGNFLVSTSTAAEVTNTTTFKTRGFDNNGYIQDGYLNGGGSAVYWNFRRAPGVHDQICYNGTGANKTETHNLGVQPELWLVKRRNATGSWTFGSTLLNNTEKIVMPSPNGRVTDATAWNSTYPTSSLLSLGTQADVNASGGTFTAYMWASTPNVSRVTSYTGNGSSQTINCNFTTGARFVMIIRATASTAQDIFVWDSARGIVAGNDPHLSLNTTAAEVTTNDSIDPDNSGFIVNQVAATNINVNGAVYIVLAYA